MNRKGNRLTLHRTLEQSRNGFQLQKRAHVKEIRIWVSSAQNTLPQPFICLVLSLSPLVRLRQQLWFWTEKVPVEVGRLLSCRRGCGV